MKDMNQFLVAAAHKSSGKTTLSIGLAAAMRERGMVVQAFKKGPDYIDPLWLGMAAGRPCHNLDFYLSSAQEIKCAYAHHTHQADLALIEGNKGLYDGLDLDGSNSNAALAQLLDVPVVLVIDAQGMTRGVAPLILGYQAFEPGLRFAGVILNQIRGSRHEAKLRAVIEHYTDLTVLGAVHHDPQMEIRERHLGLVPSNEKDAADKKIIHIGKRIAEQVDLGALAQHSRTKMPRSCNSKATQADIRRPDIRLGVAMDAAFGFYYAGDLEALEAAGAEIIPIDTLKDSTLPDIDGLFIGGGFPEVHASKLSANRRLREAIFEAIESGLPTYAECGGLMYLSRAIEWQGERYEMVGVIKGDTIMHSRPVGRGYTRHEETGNGPWSHDDTGRHETTGFAAHEFHYSSLENLPPDTRFAYRIKRGMGIDGAHDGIVYKNLLANYVHLRHVATNPWTQRFVNFIRRIKHTDHVQKLSRTL